MNKKYVEINGSDEAGKNKRNVSVLDEFKQLILHELGNSPSGFIPKEEHAYLVHIQEQLNWLADGYDPTNAVSSICSRFTMHHILDYSKMDLFSLFEKNEVIATAIQYKKIWNQLRGEELISNEENFILDILNAFKNEIDSNILDRAKFERAIWPDHYRELIKNQVDRVMSCQTDVYIKTGPIGELKRMVPKIIIFPRMADCLLFLEKQPDGVYACYIAQLFEEIYQESYFSIFVKSNGTIVSVHDRKNVVAFGYSAILGCTSFPTVNYADCTLPHKAVYRFLYADTKKTPQQKVEMGFELLNSDEVFSLMTFMYLVKTKYEGRSVTETPVYINSLMEENFIEEHGLSALSEVKDSAIFAWNQSYKCSIDPMKAVTTSIYNDIFGMHHCGDFWVELFGKGFIPAEDYVSSALHSFVRVDGNTCRLYPECIGPAVRMDQEVYRVLRAHLADFIKPKIEDEFIRYGYIDKVQIFWHKLLKERKEKVLDCICRSVYEEEQSCLMPGKTAPVQDSPTPICRSSKPKMAVKILNDTVDEENGFLKQVYDDRTGKKCRIYYQLSFDDWKEMAAVYGDDLPLIFKGFYSCRQKKEENGNLFEEATDAVGDLESRLSRLDFSMYMGFSKGGFGEIYRDWLQQHPDCV